MDIQTSKIELVKLILDIDNTEFIQKVADFVKKEKSDFWNELSLSEQKEIKKGIEDLENGKRIEFSEFFKEDFLMKVFLSELAENKLLILNEYLLQKWGLKVKNDFIAKLTKKINQISTNPESCPLSKEFTGLYKAVVSKETTFYYRIHFDLREIEIITVFDTRQNPDKLSQEI